ncbi:uncharacterized protein LOC111380354 [Olea europaea var. sylvestris]|uniref:uncharacterized protein LOC111380354 n=1 Tax=Olea europaea var. sylvestris TaxID=158386 RepID=UPI000C1D2756|nr:uncharacterized protein LOC111380354 [Olea europaea var. sylvestris]
MRSENLIADHLSHLEQQDKDPTYEILFEIKSAPWYGTPRAISDGGKNFCTHLFLALLAKYRVKYRVATPYHPQTSGQVEISNRELKKILKATINALRTDWSKKLGDALWAVGKKRIIQLNKLDEFRLGAYEIAKLYKEKTERYHDRHIKEKEFEVEQHVLIFNFLLQLFPGKLRSRWLGSFTVVAVHPYDTIEVVSQDDQRRFKDNGQRLKAYWRGDYFSEKTILPLEDPK